MMKFREVKYLGLVFLLLLFFSCSGEKAKVNSTLSVENKSELEEEQNVLENDSIKNYDFLSCMYDDSYFPTFLVDKCKLVFIRLCVDIEYKNPKSLNELYKLTQASTLELNNLENEFYQNGIEIETVARECFGENFNFIAIAYGFNADLETLMATRTW